MELRLVTIPISHYCEKARWALERAGIRYREERQAGRDKIGAIVATGGTSSKAVLFSGSSFVVALLGLLLVPDTILRSLALGAIIVGVVTMAAAITAALARGMDVPAAVRFGKRFVTRSVRGAYPLGGGVGPVSPFWRLAPEDPEQSGP